MANQMKTIMRQGTDESQESGQSPSNRKLTKRPSNTKNDRKAVKRNLRTFMKDRPESIVEEAEYDSEDFDDDDEESKTK